MPELTGRLIYEAYCSIHPHTLDWKKGLADDQRNRYNDVAQVLERELYLKDTQRLIVDYRIALEAITTFESDNDTNAIKARLAKRSADIGLWPQPEKGNH